MLILIVIVSLPFILLVFVTVLMESGGKQKRRSCQYCGEDFGVCADRTIQMHETYCPKNPENIDELRRRNGGNSL